MKGKPFDVFLSYNSDDEDMVERIAVLLADKAGLNPWFDKWILIPGEPWVRKLESGLKASSSCAVFIGKHAEGSWQIAEIESALRKQVRNPDFRVIPVILPGAPDKLELPSFLDGNTWVDFRAGIEDENSLWRLECGIRGNPPEQGKLKSKKHKPPDLKIVEQVHFDPLKISRPGGPLHVNSRFYIKRKADDEVFSEMLRPHGIVTIKGAQQTGKTSLILQVYHSIQSQRSDLRIVFVNFQSISEKNFKTMEKIWFNIVSCISNQLKIKEWSSNNWKKEADYNYNVLNFFDMMFEISEYPLIICFDEVNRVFNSPIKNDFFASIRSLYTRGAHESNFHKTRWLLSTSSEPAFFIDDINQSPFNIGHRVELNTFTIEEVKEFALRFGLILNYDDLERVMNFVGGRPYLVHTLFYHLACKQYSYEQLLDVCLAGGKIFREHLEHYLAQFQREKSLKKMMINVIQEKGCNDVILAYRLLSAGLVRRDEQQKIVPLCRLYVDFFRKELI
ncbi:MAG: AAA-like domain-containing protein [Candidatus Aminicenantes bacterium]|jgi:hypothetical protein